MYYLPWKPYDYLPLFFASAANPMLGQTKERKPSVTPKPQTGGGAGSGGGGAILGGGGTPNLATAAG